MDQERTKVWAHRGASGYVPENTLDAFQKAVEMGADGIELDVQMTKDGELVVIHDETIDRVSDGKGWVKDYTYAELKKFNFNKTHPEYEREEIPTLEQVYLLIKPTNLMINVEIKTGIVNAVDYACDILKADALHPADFNVWYPEFLDQCRKRNRRVHVWTVNDEQQMRTFCEAGVDAIITNYPDIAKSVTEEYSYGKLQPELVRKVLNQ